MSITTEEYWDCDCDENYIHPKSQKWCSICKTRPEDQPDSIIKEVLKHGFKIKNLPPTE